VERLFDVYKRENQDLKRVLFVGHSASQSGAPIILMQIARRFSEHGYKVAFLLGSGGPLLQEHEAIGSVAVLKKDYNTQHGTLKKNLKKLYNRTLNRFTVHRLIRSFRPDGIYVNTLACWPVVEHVTDKNIPLITHVHELSWVIHQYCGTDHVKKLLDRSKGVIACADPIPGVLRGICELGSKPMVVIPEFIDLERMEKQASIPNAACGNLRDSLGFSQDDYVIGVLGSGDWRKGIDLLIPLAKSVLSKVPNAKFVWMGYVEKTTLLPQLKKDIVDSGLGNCVFLKESNRNVTGFLAEIDVYASLSREDPYPLSVLEAGLFGKPVVCFDGSGGIPQYARRGAGLSVPFLSLDHFRDALIHFAMDTSVRESYGKRAREVVFEHHRMDEACERIISFAEECFK
jgi:glycosyltransferase involved in cell wall biosynthesis